MGGFTLARPSAASCRRWHLILGEENAAQKAEIASSWRALQPPLLRARESMPASVVPRLARSPGVNSPNVALALLQGTEVGGLRPLEHELYWTILHQL